MSSSLDNVLDNVLTKAEKRRLFYLDSPKMACWGYWGVLRSNRVFSGMKLMSEIGEFQESPDYPWLKYHTVRQGRRIRGRIWLKIPELTLVRPRQLGGPVEAEIFVGIEGDDPKVWQEAVKLYRQARRLYVAKGRGGKPGEIAWKIVAQRLREYPEEFDYYLWLLVNRKLKRWVEEYGPVEHNGRDRDDVVKTERDMAVKLAYAEMLRALRRVGLRVSELKARAVVKVDEP